jgi:hypothetical protein
MALIAQRVLPRQPSLNKKGAIKEKTGTTIISIVAACENRVRDTHGRAGKHRIAPGRTVVAIA